MPPLMMANAGDRPPRYGNGEGFFTFAGDRPPRYGNGEGFFTFAGDRPPRYGNGEGFFTFAGDRPPRYGNGSVLGSRTAPFIVGRGPSHATRACERVSLAMLRSIKHLF